MVGVIILFAAYAINRFVMNEATKKLGDADKLRLFEVFSKRNNYTTILLFALVVVYFGALKYFPQLGQQLTIVYLIAFVAYLLFRFVSNYKKLKQMELPAEYIKSFVISYSIFIFGVLVMAYSVFSGLN